LARVQSSPRPYENVASQRVLAKAGFASVGHNSGRVGALRAIPSEAPLEVGVFDHPESPKEARMNNAPTNYSSPSDWPVRVAGRDVGWSATLMAE
jgi:hypothetical protein